MGTRIWGKNDPHTMEPNTFYSPGGQVLGFGASRTCLGAIVQRERVPAVFQDPRQEGDLGWIVPSQYRPPSNVRGQLGGNWAPGLGEPLTLSRV